jgi:hypothetical protein
MAHLARALGGGRKRPSSGDRLLIPEFRELSVLSLELRHVDSIRTEKGIQAERRAMVRSQGHRARLSTRPRQDYKSLDASVAAWLPGRAQ